MISLVLTAVVLIAAYFVQDTSPWVAGLMAVIPVKILGVAGMAWEEGGVVNLSKSIEGMLEGQIFVLILLLIAFAFLGHRA